MPRKHTTSVREMLEKLTKEPHPSPPATIKELEELVRTRDTKCTCDICRPERYDRINCIRWPHLKLDLHRNLTKNRYGHTVYAPPKLSTNFAWPPETMHLTRTLIEYFDRPWEYLNDEQLAARRDFCQWKDKNWSKIIDASKGVDSRVLVSEGEVRQLLKWIAQLFFGGEIAGLKFRWKPDLGNLQGRMTYSPFGPPKIDVDPLKLQLSDFDRFAVLTLISVLVHETIHAVLDYHGCTKCWTRKVDLNAGSHGRAFQLLGAKLEEVFARLLGLPLRLARWESLLQSWKKLKPLPSPHDLATFRLENLNQVSGNEGDIRGLLQRTETLFRYIPRDSMGPRDRAIDVGNIAAIPARKLGEAADREWVLTCLFEEPVMDLEEDQTA